MKRTLKATTALLASVNLAVPLPALAQAEAQRGEAVSRAAEACALDETSAECQAATEDAIALGATDEEIEAAGEAEGSAEASAPTAPEAPAEVDTPAQADAEASAQAEAAPGAAETSAAASEESANVTAEGEAEATAPAPDQADAPVEPAEEAQGADASASAQGEADQDNSSESEASQEQPAEPQAAETSAGEATPQSQGTAETTTSEAGSDLPSEDDLRQGLSAGTASNESTATETEAEAQTTGEAEVTTEAPEADGEGDLPSEDELRQGLSAGTGDATETEAETEADADADAAAEGETVEGTAIEEETSAETSTAPDAEVNAEAGATAQTDAEVEAMAGTAPVAAAAAEDAEVVETTSDTVTEETARSSTEDFDSAISRQPAEQTQAQAGNNDRGGLSNLEKALLVGAGALAVGAILNGNRRVVASSEDRVVVSGRDGGYELIKDDTALLRQPGAEVRTETFEDGSTRTTVTYDDGSQVVTIRDADLRVVRRVRVTPDGERIVLIDDLNQNIQPVDRSRLRPVQQQSRTVNLSDEQALRQALSVQRDFDRAYSLSQVRNIAEVRQQVPAVDLDAITFDTGSAAIRPEQADELRGLGTYIRETIASDPRAVFLVEGHTDAVGDAAYNLALSDRRAESVALALGEYFNVPTANLVVQGYGERYLKVPTQGPERANRRATVRNITPLLQVAAAN